jgi:hypothetical protein
MADVRRETADVRREKAEVIIQKLALLTQISFRHPPWPPFKGGNNRKSPFEAGFRGMLV